MLPGGEVDGASLDAGSVDASVVDDDLVADPKGRTVVALQVEVPPSVGGDLDFTGEAKTEVVLALAGADLRDRDPGLLVGGIGLLHGPNAFVRLLPELQDQSGSGGDGRGGGLFIQSLEGDEIGRDARCLVGIEIQ